MKVENYRTNVKNQQHAKYLLKTLQLYVSDCHINFDFKTNYLSVVTSREVTELVCNVMTKHGVVCEKIKV